MKTVIEELKDFTIITIIPDSDVICDLCGTNYTNNDTKGGLVFSSTAVCPACERHFRKTIKQHNEEKYIKGEALYGESFYDFIIRFRKEHY